MKRVCRKYAVWYVLLGCIIVVACISTGYLLSAALFGVGVDRGLGLTAFALDRTYVDNYDTILSLIKPPGVATSL